jgi:hypothetical protein
LWQVTKDLAICGGKGLCQRTDKDEIEACIKRSIDDFQKCLGDIPPKYPGNPDGTLPFPKR